MHEHRMKSGYILPHTIYIINSDSFWFNDWLFQHCFFSRHHHNRLMKPGEKNSALNWRGMKSEFGACIVHMMLFGAASIDVVITSVLYFSLFCRHHSHYHSIFSVCLCDLVYRETAGWCFFFFFAHYFFFFFKFFSLFWFAFVVYIFSSRTIVRAQEIFSYHFFHHALLLRGKKS